ncbi:hypothetical protein LQW54_006043 [Pestalotiopsis sp. IQ-011]
MATSSAAPDITRSPEPTIDVASANQISSSDGGPATPYKASESTSLMSSEKPSNAFENVDITTARSAATTSGAEADDADPLDMGRHRRGNVTRRQMGIDHPRGDRKKLKKFYNKQNELIDQFLGADDEERLAVEEDARVAPRIKFAVNASFVVNFGLFIIQLYAAVSTGSLSVESARALGAGHSTDSEELKLVPIIFVGVAVFCKASLMLYCLAYRNYPTVHVFFVDHRNDIVVNIFGLVMSVVGSRFVWYLDPIGAICIGLLILISWVSNAFEQMWLLVGKSAPREFLAKLVYMSMTHDPQVLKVDTCRAYHAGQKYYVEVDIVMAPEVPLRVSHDVGQSLQRKLEGLGDVERAFVHVDYEHDHDIHTEHKPLYEKQKQKPKRTLREVLLCAKKTGEAAAQAED